MTTAVEVLLFARAKELAGSSSLTIEIVAPPTVGSLRRSLAESRPSLAEFLERCAIAVDDEYAEDDRVISPTSRIAVLPPVSGG